MKHVKRALALALVLALALALPLSARADENSPFFITQPQSQNLPYGSDIVLSVEVNAPPAGWTATYQWHRVSGTAPSLIIIKGATEPTLRLAPGDHGYQISRPYQDGIDHFFSCIVIFQDDQGNDRGIASSNSAKVQVATKPADDLPYAISSPKDVTISYGRQVLFRGEVHVPEGWTVSYDWYGSSSHGTLSAEPNLLLSYGDQAYPETRGGDSYYCNIIVTDRDGDSFYFQPQARIFVGFGLYKVLDNMARSSMGVIIIFPLYLPVVWVSLQFVRLLGQLPPVS